ncbi:MAG: isocitrate/isopropylmalate dehydrogenase family protein [Candidatus Jordarchaeales archaeon]
MRRYRIAVLPGDGVGREVVPEAVKVLDAAAGAIGGFELEYIEVPCGGVYYLETGKEWPDDAFDTCRKADAVLFGAVGWPKAVLPDGQLAGIRILLDLRFGLDLYANVRPARLYEGVEPLAPGKDKVDFVVVRENTEDLYAPIRGILDRGGVEDAAVDVRILTRKGCERIIDYAFKLCLSRSGAPADGKRRVTCVDKSNVLDGCRFFRKIFDEVAAKYPSVERDYVYVDAMTQWMIRSPEHYDVVVTTNMFGDILSDLSSVLIGGMGMAPSGNIGDRHAMFEPVHGTAPDIAGKNVANPIGSILSAKMMLEWLAQRNGDSSCSKAAQLIEQGVAEILAEGKVRTPDLCKGKYANVKPSRTSEVGDAIAKKIESRK